MSYGQYAHERGAKVNIAAELERRGWTIYGFKEDQSDSMTDYYSPATWDGIAEKAGAVICIGVSPADVSNRSGGYETTQSVEVGTCPRCNGTQIEPGGWTLEEARKRPEEYNRDRIERKHGPNSGVMDLMPHVVSPIPFIGGRERCYDCGDGKVYRFEKKWVPWPQFQANPPRCKWHVEKDGVILDKGIGLKPCYSANYHLPEIKEKVDAAIKKLVDRMERAAFGKTQTPPAEDEEGTPISEGMPGPFRFVRDKDWTWLYFASKPGQGLRDALKLSGWRWSKKRTGWYNVNGDDPPAEVWELTRQEAAGE